MFKNRFFTNNKKNDLSMENDDEKNNDGYGSCHQKKSLSIPLETKDLDEQKKSTFNSLETKDLKDQISNKISARSPFVKYSPKDFVIPINCNKKLEINCDNDDIFQSNEIKVPEDLKNFPFDKLQLHGSMLTLRDSQKSVKPHPFGKTSSNALQTRSIHRQKKIRKKKRQKLRIPLNSLTLKGLTLNHDQNGTCMTPMSSQRHQSKAKQ